MRIKEGKVLVLPERTGEVGRPVTPPLMKQVNRHIAMDEQTFRVANELKGAETLSKYIRDLICEDYRRR